MTTRPVDWRLTGETESGQRFLRGNGLWVDEMIENMINNILVPEYKELWPLLVHDRALNGNVVDDASLEVMLRIENEMRRLKVMGDDERRSLWLEIHLPGRRYYWGEDKRDRNGNIWYWISTGNYRGFHYLLLGDNRHRCIDLRSQPYVGEVRNPEHIYTDVREPLLRLEEYVKRIVDAVCVAPDKYNEYIEENLPYWKRHGTIRRSALNGICPLYKRVENPEAEVELLENVRKCPLTVLDEMTLNTYMHYWRLAYVAYRTRDDIEPDSIDEYADSDDREVFRRSSKGYNLEEYDLDSQEDFIRWKDGNSLYHCLDVAYARIHLWPVREDDGLWHFEISYNVCGYFRDVLNIVRALYEQGIIIGINLWADDALAQLKEEDTVRISPCPNKYRKEISLPTVGDGVTRRMVNAIIRETVWDNEEPVWPEKVTENGNSSGGLAFDRRN